MASNQVEVHVFLFHVFSFSLYSFNIIYEKLYIRTPGSHTYGGRWKYLTFLNEVLQFTYFTWAMVDDILAWILKIKKKSSTWFGRSRDFIFTTITFPLAMLVSVVFWGVYAIDRELIYPAFMDTIIPRFVNHILHTACCLLMIIEAFIVHHEYPAKKTGLLTIFSIAIVYFLWMVRQVYVLSHWPYSFLDGFSIFQHGVFFSSCCGLLSLFYFAGQNITILRMKLFDIGQTKSNIF